MNVFILCTGRCGSTTFIRACSHISNYSSAHESRSALLGPARMQYPAQHIEADNRLSWLLGRLDREYGDDAYYVHLTRDTRETAFSYANRHGSGIINAYRGKGIIMGLPDGTDTMSIAIDYCDTVNTNIEFFLKDKTRVMRFELEHAKETFPSFCSWIGAQVTMESALAEFDTRHNVSKVKPPRTPWWSRWRPSRQRGAAG